MSPLTILEIPLETKIGATILNTSVFGTFITFWSLLQNLFAFLRCDMEVKGLRNFIAANMFPPSGDGENFASAS